MLAQHEAESAKQQVAAEARALEAEAVARETITKHQVDSGPTSFARTRAYAHDTCAQSYTRALAHTRTLQSIQGYLQDVIDLGVTN